MLYQAEPRPDFFNFIQNAAQGQEKIRINNRPGRFNLRPGKNYGGTGLPACAFLIEFL